MSFPKNAEPYRLLKRGHYPLFLFFLLCLISLSLIRCNLLNASDDIDLREEASRGIDLYYNFEFEKAINCFDNIILEYPEEPLGYFLKEEVYWTIALNKDQEPKAYSDFLEAMSQAVKKAEAELKKNNKNVESLFILGSCYSRHGMLLGKMGKEKEAINLIMKGRSFLQKVRKVDPKYYDAYTALGICDYFVATRSKIVRLVSAMVYHLWGNKDMGKLRLKIAMRKGIYTRNEAQFYLALFMLRYEKKWEEAFKLIDDLHQRYPNNLTFYGLLAYCYRRSMRYDEAAEMYSEILEKALRQDILGQEGLNTTRYFLSESLRKAGRYQEALAVLNQLININPSSPDWLIPYVHLDIARCYDSLGEREQAIIGYQRVLKLEDKRNSHSKAKEYLKKPFKEKYLGDEAFIPQ